MNNDLIKKTIYDSVISRVNTTLIEFDKEILPALANRVKVLVSDNEDYLDGYLTALEHVSTSLNSLVINLED